MPPARARRAAGESGLTRRERRSGTSDASTHAMRRAFIFLVGAVAIGIAPLACAAVQPLGPARTAPATGSRAEAPLTPASAEHDSPPTFVDAGLKPPPDGKQLPEGGSLRPQDSALIPDATGLPDAITPPMLHDASLPAEG